MEEDFVSTTLSGKERKARWCRVRSDLVLMAMLDVM